MSPEERRRWAERLIQPRPEMQNFQDQLTGQGRFRDSGRQSSGVGEALDSVVGAPVRQGISELQNGNVDLDALRRVAARIGADPQNAPTGSDIADRALDPADSPYANAALATLVDVGAQVPLPGSFMPGVAGKLKNITPESEAILKRIGTAEQAVALKGAEREAYLKALDEKFGDRAARATDMGFGDKTWYHGSSVDIPAFKNEAKGLSTNAQSAKRGFFFAEDPSTASDYADLAHEKGVIREGDKVTTRWMSDTPEPDKLGYGHYENARAEWEALAGSERREAKRLSQIAEWDNILKNPPEWAVKMSEREGRPLAEIVAEKTSRIREPIPQASPQEIAQAKAAYFQALKDFAATNDPNYVEKIFSHDLRPGMPDDVSAAFEAAIKHGRDINTSGGQNVLAVRLRPGEGKVRVKDYKGSGYRDDTYANVMSRAQDAGNSGVLFKNTYDPADPQNRVLQNIAAVFEPNQIRSVNAAFDPRFKDSPLLLAGKAGTPQAAPLAPMSEALKRRRKKKEE